MKYPNNIPGRHFSYLIIAILFALWVVMFLSFLSSRPTSITTIEQRLKPLAEYDLPFDLNRSDIFRQSFVARHNNLGQIAVRFHTHQRINDDQLIFRIRHADSPDWNYVATYKTDQFQPDQLFPFGFPQYPDSGGEKYIWELESTVGETLNSVSISDMVPVSVSRYQFDKISMAQDRGLLTRFIFYKTINVLRDPDSLLNLLLWGSPLITYLIAISSSRTNSLFMRISPFIRVSAIPFIILILDSFFVTTQYDTVTTLLFAFWFIITLSYQPPRIYLAGLVILNLSLSLILNLLDKTKQSDKPFTWFILFLLIFVINDIYRNSKYFESRQKPQKTKK